MLYDGGGFWNQTEGLCVEDVKELLYWERYGEFRPAMEKKNEGDNWLTCVHLEMAVKMAVHVFSLSFKLIFVIMWIFN